MRVLKAMLRRGLASVSGTMWTYDAIEGVLLMLCLWLTTDSFPLHVLCLVGLRFIYGVRVL